MTRGGAETPGGVASAGQLAVVSVTPHAPGRAYALVVLTLGVLPLLSRATPWHKHAGLSAFRTVTATQHSVLGVASEPATYVTHGAKLVYADEQLLVLCPAAPATSNAIANNTSKKRGTAIDVSIDLARAPALVSILHEFRHSDRSVSSRSSRSKLS